MPVRGSARPPPRRLPKPAPSWSRSISTARWSEKMAQSLAAHQHRTLGDRGRRRQRRRHPAHGRSRDRRVWTHRYPREQRRRDAARRHHGHHRSRLGPHSSGEREGRVLLPADGRPHDDPAPQRAHHQHRLDRRQRLRGRVECRLCRQQGRRHQPDEDWRHCSSPSTTSTSMPSAPA